MRRRMEGRLTRSSLDELGGVPKRKFPNEGSQTKVIKRKFPNESSQAKDPKQKFPSEGSY